MRLRSVPFLAGVTPSGGGGGGGDLTFIKASTPRQGEFGGTADLTFASNVSAGNHVLAAFVTDSQSRNFSGTGATLDATNDESTNFRAQGLRTPSVGAAATVFPYSLTTGWNFGGVAIEVAGNAPVFDAVFGEQDLSGDASMRTLPITVADDNSIVLVIMSTEQNRTWTFGGGLTDISGGASFQPCAWAKLNAGSHNLTMQPSAGTVIYGYVAFVWSPGP